RHHGERLFVFVEIEPGVAVRDRFHWGFFYVLNSLREGTTRPHRWTSRHGSVKLRNRPAHSTPCPSRSIDDHASRSYERRRKARSRNQTYLLAKNVYPTSRYPAFCRQRTLVARGVCRSR